MIGTGGGVCRPFNYLEVYMKDAVIKYLPNTTTDEEIRKIRQDFNDKDVSLILIISGKEKLLNCLQSLINVD